ncbi:MAG: type II secretion system F family protein [Clostridiales bacterium]|nr:type II secretion system F family protein [Clostridiales bacterium]
MVSNMFLSQMSIVIMCIGTVLIVLFLILLLVSGRKYQNLIEPLEEKEFPLHELYTFGLMIGDIFKLNFNSKKNVTRKKECELWYGRQYALYYLKIYHAKKITFAVLVFLLSFLLYGFTRESTILLMFIIMSVALYMYFGEELHNKIKVRSQQLLREFPEAVSQLALLVNAGMILREAWRKTAESGTGELHRQMRKAISNMDNGMSEIEAYSVFSQDCVVPEIKKFTSVLIQNLTKGNSEFCEMLKQQSNEIWMQRQALIKQQGEKAAAKLLIPSSIMFIGILIMIIVPIFSNM